MNRLGWLVVVVSIALAAGIFSPQSAFADPPPPVATPEAAPSETSLTDTKVGTGQVSFSIPCKLKLGNGQCDDIKSVLDSIVTILMSIAASLFFFMFLYGGIQYVSGAGVPASTQTAKTTMANAIIGLVVVIGAWAVIAFVVSSLK